MKLWEKGTQTDNFVEQFTTGNDRQLDYYLAGPDVLGTIAHVKMLEKTGLLKKDELKLIHKELVNIFIIIEQGNFII